jgi:beta-lactamase class A
MKRHFSSVLRFSAGFTAMFLLFVGADSVKMSTPQPGLEDLVRNFGGQAGIYVYCPAKELEISVNADSLFPTASMIKVPILCTLWDKVASGTLNPDSMIRFYPDSLHYPWKGEDALGRFAPGEEISVRHLMTHMITFSDNHASLYLQQLAGSGTSINNWLQRNGFSQTRVNSRTEGRSRDYDRFGWGQTTPREMATLLWKIRQGKIASPAISEAIYRHLTRIYWNGEALSQIPPVVQCASKQGAVDRSKSEVVLVNAPHGDYVFCVITKNQQDTSWTHNNEGYRLIRTVSAMLWKYFESGMPYMPSADMERYLP